jgi:hypothetical protein
VILHLSVVFLSFITIFDCCLQVLKNRNDGYNVFHLIITKIWIFYISYLLYFKYWSTSAIPGSIPGVGTNIYLGLIWVPCSLAIVTAMTSLWWHKSQWKIMTISEMVATSSYKYTVKKWHRNTHSDPK